MDVEGTRIRDVSDGMLNRELALCRHNCDNDAHRIVVQSNSSEVM